MGAYGLENDKFYSFGRTTRTRNTFADKNGDYANFIAPGLIAGGGVVGTIIKRGRKKRADKARQAIQDKYETLDVGCGGIDNSIRIVSSDLSSLKANKPKKKKDQRDWDAQVSETEEIYRELGSKKRQLVCVEPSAPTPVSPVVPVVVKDEIPTTPDKQNGMPTSNGIVKKYPKGLLDSADKYNAPSYGQPSQSGQTQEGGASEQASPKKKTWLYVLLGLAVVGGVVYYMRRK